MSSKSMNESRVSLVNGSVWESSVGGNTQKIIQKKIKYYNRKIKKSLDLKQR